MKLGCNCILQILLIIIATHTVLVNSNFMDTLVTFFKATSKNQTAFDLKKFIDKSDENDRLDTNNETVKHNLFNARKHEDKSNHTTEHNSKATVNNTNSGLLQQPKYIDSNSPKNYLGPLQTFNKNSNHMIENNSNNDSINWLVLHLSNDPDFNSAKNASVTSQTCKNSSKRMHEVYDLSSEKLNVATPISVMAGRRVNLVKGNSFQDEQRNENKDYVDKKSSSSSSREFPDWKEEFKKLWRHKKFEALNYTRPKGDETNMGAARPWGVMCGDPAQHDMPWGNCLLAMECEPEYRIYRGDFFCGRTMFVCCALQLSTYDMYQDFDISFGDKEYSTDSEETRNKHKSSRESKRYKLEQEKRKRQKAREKSTLKIRKNIKKIIKEIRKILNKQYRNGTRERKRRTRLLKRFIKKLKSQFKKDRKAVKDMHDQDMVFIDNDMASKLGQVKVMNEKFMQNETFRNIVVNGSITKEGARLLLRTYPELEQYVEDMKNSESRRSMTKKASDEDLLYDIANEYN